MGVENGIVLVSGNVTVTDGARGTFTRAPLLYFLTCSLLQSATHALTRTFKVEGRYRQSLDGTTLARRGNADGSLRNNGDLSYYANVTIKGQSFAVLIDTGRCVSRLFNLDKPALSNPNSCSADLWVSVTVQTPRTLGRGQR